MKYDVVCIDQKKKIFKITGIEICNECDGANISTLKIRLFGSLKKVEAYMVVEENHEWGHEDYCNVLKELKESCDLSDPDFREIIVTRFFMIKSEEINADGASLIKNEREWRAIKHKQKQPLIIQYL